MNILIKIWLIKSVKIILQLLLIIIKLFKIMIGQIKKVGSDIMFHAITHANVHDVIALLNDNEVDVNCVNING